MIHEINQIITVTQTREQLRLLLNDELDKINESFIDLETNKLDGVAIEPGTDIAVTGTGSSADPYVISFTGESSIPPASEIGVDPIEGFDTVNVQDAIEQLLARLSVLDAGTLSFFVSTGLIQYNSLYDPELKVISDSAGASNRPVLLKRYGSFDSTTAHLAGSIAAGTTVVSSQGTSTLSIETNKLNGTIGTAWSIVLSNGSRYEVWSREAGSPTVYWLDVSGQGRHLVATGFTDVGLHVGESLEIGSDHYNALGYSDGTGTYAGVKVPASITNPAMDCLGNPLQYPGRVRYPIRPKQSNCSTWTTGTSLTITGITGATITSKEGTAVVAIGTNVITRVSDGTLYNLRLLLSNGRTLVVPFSEGAGDQVLAYDSTGVNYTGTISTTDLTAFWSGKQDTYFPGLEFGYRQWGAIQVPANPYTPGLACDGQPLDPVPPSTLYEIYNGDAPLGIYTRAYMEA